MGFAIQLDLRQVTFFRFVYAAESLQDNPKMVADAVHSGFFLKGLLEVDEGLLALPGVMQDQPYVSMMSGLSGRLASASLPYSTALIGSPCRDSISTQDSCTGSVF